MHPADDVLNDYVDDALGAAERADVERHLASCASCRALVEDLREIRATAKSLEFREPPARVWPRLERAIRLEREARQTVPEAAVARSAFAWPRRQLLRQASFVLAAAAAILLAV